MIKLTLKTNNSTPGLKFLQRLKEVYQKIPPKSKTEFIPFPDVFQKLCVSFSIKKQEAWNWLFIIRDLGFIEVVASRGIKLNYELLENKL